MGQALSGGQEDLSLAVREDISVHAEDGTLEARWQPGDKLLTLSLALKPDTVEALRGQA
jgi:hypothetical protein